MEKSPEYVIEMLHITKEFPGIKANDDITLQLKKGEIHALLGENGAGKSTLMSVLFGLYQPEAGEIRKNGVKVEINDPNDATALKIGMVHQHFKLVEVFTVLDNIILGAETTKLGFIQKKEARTKVQALSEKYGLHVDLDAKVEDITVGMQQRVEILKMLYRDNEILIFDEPTAVLTPQEIDELMATMREFAKEGKSILFISHKLNEIMDVSDRVTVLRKGKYVGTVNTSETNKQELSNMMVGRPVQLEVVKDEAKPTDEVLLVEHFSVPSRVHKRNAVDDVSFSVRKGEIVCVAGIDGNGQSELIYGLTGLDKSSGGKVTLCGEDITHTSIAHRGKNMSHIPEDRHKYGLVLDFTLEQNMVLQRFQEPQFEKAGFINNAAVMGAVFSLLLSFASINLRADQTIGGTALNLLAPALVLFFVRIIANQNTLQMQEGDAASWFMIKKTTLGFEKNADLGFLGNTLLNKVYLATYVCIILFIVLSIILYKTKFGLRLRACGENPQAVDSPGINVYKMRYAGVTIGGALAGMGGFVYALTTANCTANGDVAGFGFLALAVMIFGNWKPLNIAGASILFGLFKCIAASYASLDINGDGVYALANIGISPHFYRMLPYLITIIVLAFTSKSSRAPKAEGIPYDTGSR